MNPVLTLIIANLIWGAASPIFKLALTNVPPFTLAFIRFFFAAIFFLFFMRKKWQKISGRDFLLVCLSAFFGISINIAFFFLGLQKTVSINAPIIASAGPVFLYLLSIFILKEKPKLKIFYGMVIALFGVMIIILSPIFVGSRQLVLGEIEGNLFFVLATIGSILNTLINKDVLKRINPYLVTFIGFVFGSVTFIPFMLPELSSWRPMTLNINGWLGIIFGVFLSSGLAYLLYNYGISKIKAQEVGLFTYIDPVVAVLIAIPLLHEYPNLYYLIGSVMVFLGIYFAEKRIHWHPLHKLKEQSDQQ
jgi:drug/metabolite transporter (DMT)-like permease